MTITNVQDSSTSRTDPALVIRERRRQKLVFNLLDNFVWVLVVLLLIVAWITTPSFFQTSILVSLLTQSSVLALLTLAETICLLAGYFDMSIESTLIFTAVFTAWLVTPHIAASGLELNPVLGIVAMLGVGALIGWFNGFLVAYAKMNAFITTLAVSIILIGSCVTLSRGNTLGPFPDLFSFFGEGSIGFIPVPVVVVALVYGCFYLVLKHSSLGRKIYAVGGNARAAQASGINVKRIVLVAYVLSGLISALAALILVGRMGAAVSHMTRNNLLYAFAAAVIGGVNPFGGQGKVVSIFGGVILLTIINKLLVIADVDPFLIPATSGVIVLVAMAVLTVKQRWVVEA